MKLPRNSIWLSKDSDLLDDNLYRIIDVIYELQSIILFPVSDKSTVVRPVAVSLVAFSEQVKAHRIKESKFELPSYFLVDEENISKEHIARRDKNYLLIEELVIDRDFLFKYATQRRVHNLVDHMRKVKVDRKTLARLLTKYWRYGQSKMALIPAFSQSGGLGKQKKVSDRSLGAPRKARILIHNEKKNYIVHDKDRSCFKKALKKYYLKERGLTLSKTYENLLKDYYKEDICVSDAQYIAPFIPSFRQFQYWSKKFISKDMVIKKRTTENDYLRNKRGVTGSVNQNDNLPGSHFEIDATVADVHIVSEFGPQYILGRPTIYIVADRASRMIVGMHVSLFYASWRAARQALVNCFLPKENYCSEFGIDIQNSEWPCHHIPLELVCDNGEMIGLKPKDALTPMTRLSFNPPYRPDCKGVVEKRFDIINKETLHELSGTTRGGVVIRGARDPRKDAIYTLKELTAEIIKSVLEHNRSIFENLAFSSPLLIENNLSPSPINYWNIHISKHKHNLSISTQDEVIARLLPPDEVSMTRSGIYYNGLYYSCAEIEERHLATIARSSGRWRLEARIDENTTNYIYVRLDKNRGFTRCDLLDRSAVFKDKTMIESELMQDWLKSKKAMNPISVESIADHKHRQLLAKSAKKRRDESPKVAFSEKIEGIKQRRKHELEQTTNIIATQEENNTLNTGSSASVVIPLPKGRKRKTTLGGNNND